MGKQSVCGIRFGFGPIATVLFVLGSVSNSANGPVLSGATGDGNDATVAPHPTGVSYFEESVSKPTAASPINAEIVTSNLLDSTIKENPFAETATVVRAADSSDITVPEISAKDGEFKVTGAAEVTAVADEQSHTVVPTIIKTRQTHGMEGEPMTKTISALVTSITTENALHEGREVAEGATAAVTTHKDGAVEEKAVVSIPRQVNSTDATTLPYCTCDLTEMCDIGCCCDRSCNLTNPYAVFVSCLLGSTRVVSQVCVEDFLIFRTNAPYQTAVVKESGQTRQYCIEVDNPSLNYFVEPQTVNSTNFQTLVSQYGGPSFIKASQSLPQSSSFYRVGDPILTYFTSTSILGVLGLPGKLGNSAVCTDASPAGFLQRKNTTCSRTFTDLSNQCYLPSLRASTYYSGFVVLKIPDFSKASLHEMQVNITLESTLLSPRLTEKSCTDVVSEVYYLITYNGTSGIQNVSVNFKYTNISTDSKSMLQTFIVQFVNNPRVPAILVRSGNPGYITGAPLLALTDNGDLVPVTILQPTANGLCTQTLRSTVPFRYNMRSSCTYSFPETGKSNCAQLRNESYLFLQGKNMLKSLAALGNASASQTAFWADLILGNCAVQSKNENESCTLPTGLDIQIVWAYVGQVSNPQAQVLGGRFLFSCKTITCCNESISLVTTVTFYDTTSRPVPPRGEPQINWRYPFDFFFPFKAAISGVRSYPALDIYTVVLCLFTLNFTRMWHR